MTSESDKLKNLYSARFHGDKELEEKNRIWKILCKHFFQKYITTDSVVADIASGYCEFINNIQAKEKFAIDLNPDIKNYSDTSVHIVNDGVAKLKNVLPFDYIDIFFISNFLEHLNSKEQIIELISDIKEIIKEKGRIIILQPNIKYVKKGRYWDFFDHKIPLTENALIELAEMNNMKVIECIPKFLPYTTKSAMPKNPFLIWLYLKTMPLSSHFFGEQSLLIFEKKSAAGLWDA